MLKRVLIVLALILAFTSVARGPALAADNQYIAVIDAGSSGKRLTLYSGRFTVDDAAFPRSPAWTSGYAITVLRP